MGARRCAIYARISVSKEESVSIARQVEAAEQYAAARGWQVAGTFRDDGVSASHNKPEDRAGWRALLDSPETFDAVVVWKIDRLSRRVLDFLHADETLQTRGAGIVCVEQTIDMTTAEGRGFATMLAVFGEMEAAAISDRVRDARTHLLTSGRVVGGTVPYGWRSIPNPEGPGLVLARDPDRIDYVRGMVERAQRGDSVYSIVQWLDEVGAPMPQKSHKKNGWSYSTVERLLRNPVLAGMTAHNPGNRSKVRGEDYLRDENGLPVVDESVAILPQTEWRALVQTLDDRDSGQSRPRALRSKTSPLLSGLIRCGYCKDVRMWRNNIQGRPGYYCKNCRQSISNLEDYVIEQFLWAKGEHVRWSIVEEVHEGGSAMLPEIEHRLDELDDLIRRAEDRAALRAEQDNLINMRDEARATAPTVEYVPVRGTQTFGEDWAAAETVEAQREILDDAIQAIWVARGRTGRGLDTERLIFDWKMPEQVGPLASDEELERTVTVEQQ